MNRSNWAWQYFSDKPSVAADKWPLMAEPVLTPRERELHRILVSAYPDHFVFAQVALSRLIAVIPGTLDGEIIRSHYKQLVADFVLCRPDYSVIVVIELDDLPHRRAERQDADQRKTKAVQSAGLRLVRIPAAPIPDIARLRQLLERDPREVLADLRQAARPPVFAAGTSAAPRPAISFLIGVAAIVGAWVLFSQGPKVRQPTAGPAYPPAMTGAPSKLSTASVVNSATQVQRPKIKRVDPERAGTTEKDAVALQTRKETAWAAYYIPPASCENPSTRSERVDCRNRFLRARREFELQWKSQKSSNP